MDNDILKNLRQSLWDILTCYNAYSDLPDDLKTVDKHNVLAKRIINLVELEAPAVVTLLIINLRLDTEFGIKTLALEPSEKISLFDALYSMDENQAQWQDALQIYKEDKNVQFFASQILFYASEIKQAISEIN